MKHAPETFSGTWLDFYSEHVQPNLIATETVERVHEWMKQYCREADVQFPVRYVTGIERRRQYFTSDGTCIIPCDNSPAWKLHALLLCGEINTYATFRDSVPTLPRHFHDAVAHETVWRYGWYVAHIFPAKNRDTDYQNWNRPEVERRFLTALHPCNIFFVPRICGRTLGEDSDVISFFADQYRHRYERVWADFLDCIRVRPLPINAGFGNQSLDVCAEPDRPRRPDPPGDCCPTPKTIYSATRLLFRELEIEALEWDESFEVRTPVGNFRMTKREFYSAFSNVVSSTSYLHNGIYHYPTLPKKAQRFRV